MTQPSAWADALAATGQLCGNLRDSCRAGQFDEVVFTGGRSLYYLGRSAGAWPAG